MPYSADQQIAGLDAAAALTGAEIAALSQGGATVRETLANIRTFYEKRTVAGARALAQLAGEEGLYLDFLGRSAAVRDYAQAKNFIGRPDDLLTVSRASVAAYFDRDRLLKFAGTGVLRYDHDPVTGAPLAALVESSRTNVVLHNRDLTNAAWTKTNVSAVKDQTGVDGVSSSASRITASAGNGTCLQAITLASSARFQTAYVKRLVGSGTVEMTMDNGSTWTAISPTSVWTRVSIPSQTLANPTVGFRIVTNGDSIAVDLVQNEDGDFASSAIETAAGTVTRAADVLSVAYASLPASVGGNELTLFVDVDLPDYAANITKSLISMEVSSTERASILINSSEGLDAQSVSAGSDTAVVNAPTIATRLTKAALGLRANDAASSAGGSGGATVDSSVTLPSGTYSSLKIGNINNTNQPFGYVRRAAYFPRRFTSAELNALTA